MTTTSAPAFGAGDRPAGDVLVSICITNFNYRQYVGAAVDSALAQTYPAVEVVVVDDGSTDGSLELLQGYGDRIRLQAQANSGQISAVNRAFAASTGVVVLFLDADDLLQPHAVASVVAALRPGAAKVQFRQEVIDAHGDVLGVFPHRLLELDQGDVRPLLCREGEYVGPVTSGNAYVRTALAHVLPLEGGAFATLTDGAGVDGFLNSMTPFFGTVVSVDDVLGSYRSHGGNHSAASGAVPLAFARWRVDHELRREAEIRRLATSQGLRVHADLMCANPEHVLLRLLSLRLAPADHPVPGDSRAHLLRAVLSRGPRSHSSPPARRLFVVVTCVLCGLLPERLVPGVASWTLASRPRPWALRALASLVRGPRVAARRAAALGRQAPFQLASIRTEPHGRRSNPK